MYYHNVSAVCESVQAKTYLHAVIAISKVLHGLELLVDDTNARLVRPVHDTLNVLGTLAHCL